MSLINKQQLMWAQSDRDDALRRISAGEDSQKVKDLLAGANKRIVKIQKEMEKEETEAQAKRQAEAAKKPKAARADERPKKERPGLPADQELPCVDCASSFTFTGKDQLFFQKQGWTQPTRCADCREAKKSAKPSGKELDCGVCKVKFFFSDGKARVFEEKGWAAPKRCRDCLRAKHEKKDVASVKSGSQKAAGNA
jgi:hypothetical protein